MLANGSYPNPLSTEFGDGHEGPAYLKSILSHSHSIQLFPLGASLFQLKVDLIERRFLFWDNLMSVDALIGNLSLFICVDSRIDLTMFCKKPS